jgi:enoyl-CoA hydratase/carnithine racemase
MSAAKVGMRARFLSTQTTGFDFPHLIHPRTIEGVNRPNNSSRIRVSDVVDGTGVLNRIIELNRPEKRNCLGLEMLDSLLSALKETDAGRIILTGTGKSFCAGLDLSELGGQGGGAEHLKRLVAIFQHLLNTRQHTLALASGHAVGGGSALAACAQTTIVTDNFSFRLPGGELSRLAMVALPICGLRAGALTPATTGWIGCNVDATEASKLGLVDQIVSGAEMTERIQSLRAGGRWAGPIPRRTWGEQEIARVTDQLDQFLRTTFPPASG